jgi:two-component system phosphate regulon response regulator PhoB
MSKILLIEDDAELADKLRAWLVSEGHQLEISGTGEDGLQMLSGFQFDIAVLDWNLPGISGLEVLKRYRSNGGKTPIIFLTGQGEMDFKLEGLEAGADDYMTKPFDVRELSVRIKGILRRPPDMLMTELTARGVVLKVESRRLVAGSEQITLRPRECALLEYLMRHPNRCFSAKALLDAVWPSDSNSSEDSVRTCMRILRGRLSSIGRDDLVKTVLGSGYIVETD